MSSDYRKIIDLDFLKGLLSESVELTYDSSGNLIRIVRTTINQNGETKTITIDLIYDSSGNITNIIKTVT